MTTEALVAGAEAFLTEGFRHVLLGEMEQFKLMHLLSPSKAHEILTGLGAECLDDTDTNGWQWDHWTTYTYKGTAFTLEGSGYYGMLKLYPKEKE